jgi:release factor glutamine methyltransferase
MANQEPNQASKQTPSQPPNRGDALAWAQAQLKAAGVDDSPKLDAELLLCHGLSCTAASLYAWPEKPLTQPQWHTFSEQVLQRSQGQPIAHLLGRQGFWSLDLQVDASTLIPRPETELLVEVVLGLDLPSTAVVLDLGTGSGAIALALASERPQWHILGLDQSPAAIALAQKNAQTCQLPQVEFRLGNWAADMLKNPQQPINCIVSNPPYIDANDPHLNQGDVRYEPLTALVADDHGMADIKVIAQQAAGLLVAKGWLAFEHGYDQAELVQQLLHRLGYTFIDTQQDYNGQDRVTLGQWPA